jgi:hypothetical protein
MLLHDETYQSILLKSTILIDPVHDDANRIVKIKQSSQHVVHVISCKPEKKGSQSVR